MSELDAETKEILSDADHVKSMLNSRGWQVIKPKLDGLILDLQNINNLDTDKIDTLSTQLAARKMATELIWTWLKGDVYGFVEQQEQNAASLKEKVDEFVDRQ